MTRYFLAIVPGTRLLPSLLAPWMSCKPRSVPGSSLVAKK